MERPRACRGGASYLEKPDKKCSEPGQTEPYEYRIVESYFTGGGGAQGWPTAASKVASYDEFHWHLQASKSFGGAFRSELNRWYVDPTLSFDNYANPYRIMSHLKIGLVLRNKFGIGAIVGAGGLWAKSEETCGVELDRTSPQINMVDNSGASIGGDTVGSETPPTYQLNTTDIAKYRAYLWSPGFELGFRISRRTSFEMPVMWYLAAPSDGEIDQQFTTFEVTPRLNLHSDPARVYLGFDAVSILRNGSNPWFLGWRFGLSYDF